MALTMIISGLWHGAAWTFMCWAGLHALFLAIERVTGWEKKLSKIPGGCHAAILIVFLQICIAWVFFRATSLNQALGIIGQMFNIPEAFAVSPIKQLHPFETALYYLIFALLMEQCIYWRFFSWIRQYRWYPIAEIITVIMLFVVSVYGRGPGGTFIYFQF